MSGGALQVIRMSAGPRPAVWVATAALLVGCGGSGSHAVDGAGGAAGTAGDGAADVGEMDGRDAQTGGSDGGGNGTVDGGAGKHDGGPDDAAAAIDPFADFVNGAAIAVVSLPYELQGDSEAMIIMLRLPAAPGGMNSTCTSTRVGDCVVSHCTGYDPNVARLSPGIVHVDSIDGSIHASAGAGSNTGPRPFVGGEDLTVSATGGDVPAFSVGLHVPLMLLIEQPTTPTLYPMNVAVAAPHTAPLKLTWQRGAAGVFLVALAGGVQGFGLFGSVNVTCFFDSQGGTGIVPAAALSEMIPGQTFVLLTATAAAVEAGAERIKVWILEEALTPDRKAAVVIAGGG